jgi:hypothetical protein
VLLTRSPLEHPRKGLSVRLACVKHAASVRPEPGSNSPNKNPSNKRGESTIRENPIKATSQTGKKQHHTPKREKEAWQKTTTKQKPPNTLLSSQTTHPLDRATSPRQKPRTRSADDQEPTEVGLPSGSRRALRAGPVSQRRVNKLREGKLGVKWPDGACLSGPLSSRAHTGASTPTDYPTRSTPAIFRLPRRSTNQRSCRKSSGSGAQSSLSIRTLLT